MHYSKHSWDEDLQDFCLLGDNFICNLLHQRQNTLHPIAKTRGHLVILVLFFQELNQTLLLSLVCQQRRTHLKRGVGNTDDNLCNWVQLPGVSVFLVLRGWDAGQLTSAKTAPSLNALSSAFSIDPLIIGVYSPNNLSRSWRDKRRAST